jgi:hypothetical protein
MENEHVFYGIPENKAYFFLKCVSISGTIRESPNSLHTAPIAIAAFGMP